MRIIERRGCRGPAITRISNAAGARDGRDHSSGCDLADDVVDLVNDVKVSGGVKRLGVGSVKRRRGRGFAVSAEAGAADARDGRDHSTGVHLADDVVAVIGDEDTACGVKGDGRHSVQSCPSGEATITAEPGRARAGYRADDSRGTDLPDHVIANVGEIKVPGGVE